MMVPAKRPMYVYRRSRVSALVLDEQKTEKAKRYVLQSRRERTSIKSKSKGFQLSQPYELLQERLRLISWTYYVRALESDWRLVTYFPDQFS
ncbi:hypothetical protein KQX54_008087 [Cotesia glomerata]|uniref:Uncharacterized protein n=1 Tax=Cotesia glomerata TaxID=32391 RepID=A0AAV7IUB4_COTGL|nr:hypothetical protein KQX54_008087 [Cotesia glomerata]